MANPVLYIGVDEAGYGPRLGPLCVAYTAFELTEWPAGNASPDLWAAMSSAICREPRETRDGRLAINDSKRLKLGASKSGAPHRPITHLERGVLAFLACAGHAPTTDEQLLELLTGDRLPQLAWYRTPPEPLPLTTTPDHMTLLSGGVARAAAAANIRFLKAGCRAMDEADFNQRYARLQNKAGVSFGVIASLLRQVWDSDAACVAPDSLPPQIVVDRQGGRVRYAEVLGLAVPDAAVRVLAESDTESTYELASRPDATSPTASARALAITFRVEAEQEHLPVALASMVAKLVRELLMGRFNRYWSGRISELKPTAGYALDAGRWLKDAAPFLTAQERTMLVRQA